MSNCLSFGNDPWRLKDNRHGAKFAEKICGLSHEFLKPWSGLKFEKWQELGVTAITKERTAEDDSASLSFFTLGKDEDSRWIDTHNCMGVVRLHDKKTGKSIQIEIGSRFDSDDKNQFFLTYLLSKAFGGSFTDLVELGNDSLWDLLLAFAFRHSLDKAAHLGPYKQYQNFQHNDLHIRGKIDTTRHLRENVPFVGRMAYGTRDITYDNPTNHLIRHALTKLNRKWGCFFGSDNRLSELRRQIEQNTPTWQPGKLLNCLRQKENLMPIKHPYYQSAYEPLRLLSLSILRNEGASLYQTDREAQGVIFDGSWLWEEYLWTLLDKEMLGFEHPENKKRSGEWKTNVSGISYFPDFFHRKKRIVLDAKYRLDNKTNDSFKNDVRQVFAYMFILDAVHGGLIKPDGEANHQNLIRRQGIDRPKAWWHNFCVPPASSVTDADTFVSEMKTKEREFLDEIKKLIA